METGGWRVKPSCMFCFALRTIGVLIPHRKKQGVKSPGEDVRDKFYERYREEAGEYDTEFIKKYKEDLDTTLIFVCCPHRSGTHVLIRLAGWPVLCRYLCLHH